MSEKASVSNSPLSCSLPFLLVAAFPMVGRQGDAQLATGGDGDGGDGEDGGGGRIPSYSVSELTDICRRQLFG